eukprot:COSAG01_NODE_584_length_15174_cov_27.387901_20_plen_134_part_00
MLREFELCPTQLGFPVMRRRYYCCARRGIGDVAGEEAGEGTSTNRPPPLATSFPSETGRQAVAWVRPPDIILRVQGEITGPGKYENVGKAQSVFGMINAIISPRTRMSVLWNFRRRLWESKVIIDWLPSVREC